jgi:AcrR family transcriptional regulator
MNRPVRLSRHEQKARTRAELLAAAEATFTHHGFHGATVEGIAALAGFTKGAFYANFADKEEVFLVLLGERLRRRAEEISGVTHAPDAPDAAVEQVFDLGRRFSTYVEDDPPWQRAFLEFTIHASRAPALAARLEATQLPLRLALRSALEANPELLGGRQPDLVADAIWAAAVGVAVHSLRPGGAEASALMETLLQCILQPPSVPASTDP